MGMYFAIRAVDPSQIDGLVSDPNSFAPATTHTTNSTSLSLEKAWHGLHFLLTGSAWEGDLPFAFLLQGGDPIGEDLGYGPARVFSPAKVAEIDAAISAISEEALWSRFDAGRMSAEGIYPQIWDEPEADLREEYLGYFRVMKTLIQKAHADGQALVLILN